MHAKPNALVWEWGKWAVSAQPPPNRDQLVVWIASSVFMEGFPIYPLQKPPNHQLGRGNLIMRFIHHFALNESLAILRLAKFEIYVSFSW